MNDVFGVTLMPVAPKVGFYGLTNFGTVYRLYRPGNLPEELGRVFTDDFEEMCWDETGKCTLGGPSPLHDIVALITPKAMRWAALAPPEAFEPSKADLEWARNTSLAIASKPINKEPTP